MTLYYKIMKLTFLTLAILIAVPMFTFAQRDTQFIQISGQASVPLGNLADIIKPGFGGAAKGVYGFSDKPQSFTLEAGYNQFGVKNIPSGASAHYSSVPVYGGYRANLSGVVLEGQAGVAFNHIAGSGPGGNASANQTAFGWAFSAAYLYRSFELGLRYQRSEGAKDATVISFLGVRLGYNISL